MALVVGVLLGAGVLWDAFETIVLPRRVSRRIRLTTSFYRLAWPPYRAAGRRLAGTRRENVLSYFGPLSLLTLIALWAASLVAAFALFQWGSHVTRPGLPTR